MGSGASSQARARRQPQVPGQSRSCRAASGADRRRTGRDALGTHRDHGPESRAAEAERRRTSTREADVDEPELPRRRRSSNGIGVGAGSGNELVPRDDRHCNRPPRHGGSRRAMVVEVGISSNGEGALCSSTPTPSERGSVRRRLPALHTPVEHTPMATRSDGPASAEPIPYTPECGYPPVSSLTASWHPRWDVCDIHAVVLAPRFRP